MKRAVYVVYVLLAVTAACSRYDDELVPECMTILDCPVGYVCTDSVCTEDLSYSDNETDENAELPDIVTDTSAEQDKNIETPDENFEDNDPEETDDNIINDADTDQDSGGGQWQEIMCTDEAECDENSVCYKEDEESRCVDPFRKYWKVSIDTLCLSEKKPDGDYWDGIDLIDKPDPYAFMLINGTEALRTPYADETKCAHWQNFTNIKFTATDAVTVKMMEYDSMILNDDDSVGEYTWTEGIPVEIFKAREFVFDDSSNPGYTYIRITFDEMD